MPKGSKPTDRRLDDSDTKSRKGRDFEIYLKSNTPERLVGYVNPQKPGTPNEELAD